MYHDFLNSIIHQSGDAKDVIDGRCILIFGGCLKIDFLLCIGESDLGREKVDKGFTINSRWHLVVVQFFEYNNLKYMFRL
jgi:hypothetical protein